MWPTTNLFLPLYNKPTPFNGWWPGKTYMPRCTSLCLSIVYNVCVVLLHCYYRIPYFSVQQFDFELSSSDTPGESTSFSLSPELARIVEADDSSSDLGGGTYSDKTSRSIDSSSRGRGNDEPLGVTEIVAAVRDAAEAALSRGVLLGYSMRGMG